MSKNAEIAEEMAGCGAAIQIDGADALAPTIAGLLGDTARRDALAGAARRYVEDGDGVLRAILAELSPFLGPEPVEPRG
jgi:3-deoxy-D-manno-octulosonic-acid transferase